MIVLIIASGQLARKEKLATLINQADIVIAADGGSNHCYRLAVTPNVLLGDLDSVDPAVLAHFTAKKIEIYRHPPRKDATDLELALDLAKARGAKRIRLTGVLGGRWDMSLGNILLAASGKYRTMELSLYGPDCSMRILHSGKAHQLNGSAGRRFSLLPLHGDAHGVDLTGCAYTLKRHVIKAGSSLGTSNIIPGNQATVRLEKGTLLCIQSDEEQPAAARTETE